MSAPADIVVDGRGLEPPEPMELVLAALEHLQPGQRVAGREGTLDAPAARIGRAGRGDGRRRHRPSQRRQG